jgi:hypothetical protein
MPQLEPKKIFSIFRRMKTTILTLTLLLALGGLRAQTYSDREDPPRLYIKGTEERSGYMGIQYEINFPGFVELHLFKNEWIKEENRYDKKLLLIRGNVTDRAGLDYISFPVEPLESGERYPFELHYKGDTISRSVTIK